MTKIQITMNDEQTLLDGVGRHITHVRPGALRPDEVLDRQAALSRWSRSEAGISYQVAFARDLDAKARMERPDGDEPTAEILAGIPQIVSATHGFTGMQPSYVITRHAHDLIAQAASQLPSELEALDIPPHENIGFIHLERPITITDVRGKDYDILALSWFTAYVEDRDRDIPVLATWTGPTITDHGDELMLERTPYSLLHVAPIYNDSAMYTAPPDATHPEEGLRATVNIIRFMLAFWAFIEQRVPAITRTYVRGSRAVDRRLRRQRVTIPSEVQVIDLRQREATSHDSTGESEIAWTHRWIVSGHWRRQFYPTLNAHRLIWIAPFIKGPEDRPLLERDTLFRVTR